MRLRSLAVFVAFTAAMLGVFFVLAENPRAPQPASPSTNSVSSPQSLILQANDGEHRVQFAAGRSFPFIIKVDEQNGNAEDFFVFTEIGAPGGTGLLNCVRSWAHSLSSIEGCLNR